MKWQNIRTGIVVEGVEVLNPIGANKRGNSSFRWSVRCTVCEHEYGGRAADIAKGKARCMLCRKNALDAQELGAK